MKVSIHLTDFQLMKALALTPATEEQAKKFMAAVRETPELDITEFISSDKDYESFSLAIALTAASFIAKKYGIE